MASIGFLLLSVVFTQHTAQSSGEANDCCQSKTVGSVSYHLVRQGETKIPPQCFSSCIYEADDSPGSRVCFAHGDLPVHCLECADWQAFRIIPGGLDWARGHYHEHAFDPELTTYGQINNGQAAACNASKPFRSIDGSCNNLKYTEWGASGTPFQRFIGPAYADENSTLLYHGTPRGGFNPSSLPSPRVISTKFHNQTNKTNHKISNLFYQFGQFVAHDTGLTPEVNLDCKDLTLAGGFNNTACALPSQQNNPKCFNINITNDVFYKDKLPTYPWLGFARTLPAKPYPGFQIFGNREQVNAGTSFLDASIVYGFNITLSSQLRSHQSGKLINNSTNNLLPVLNTVASNSGLHGIEHIAAGDPRVNMHPFLLSVQTMFFREHNRLADEIRKCSPYYEDEDRDEEIFQNARRILIAEYQNIIYEEFLPLIVGNKTMKKYGLYLPVKNGSTNYSSTVNPTTHNGFQTAAMRFGHSMIQDGKLQLQNLTSGTGKAIPDAGLQFRYNYFNDTYYYKNNGSGYDQILGGLSIQGCQHFDRHVTKGVTDYLYNVQGRNNYGDDLASRNIQRGRDHGLPSYLAYREFCNLNPTLQHISIDNRNLLRGIYKKDEDIDVWTGGLAEDPTDDAIVGPLFQCLIGKQFQMFRDGDRFFFTHQDTAGSFTAKQREVIRKRTMRDLICQNSNIPKIVLKIRMHAMEIRDEKPMNCTDYVNPLKVCDFVHSA